ncbi:MAG: hypothetical protein K2N38_04185 [Oscillospiraceae bacterium]|nr:hypothetical protein [Oscillospiraceae bacterium]
MANTAKYEFTGEVKTVTDSNYTERTVRRIRALRDIEPPTKDGSVTKGDLGGWIESESNLSHSGECWVDEDAVVMGNAVVKDNAYVCNRSVVDGNAIICDQAAVDGNEVTVGEYAIICGNASVLELAEVVGHVTVKGNVKVRGCAVIKDPYEITVESNSDDFTFDTEDFLESNRVVIDGNIVIDSSIMVD